MSLNTQLNDLQTNIETLKGKLSSNITSKGVNDVSSSMTLTELADAVNRINTSGGGDAIVLDENLRFAYSKSKSIILSRYDFTAIKDASNLFYNCGNLDTIYGTLDCTNITDMNNMFNSCTMLELYNYNNTLTNTHNVTNMKNMFSYCSSLQSVPTLDCSSCTNMDSMFFSCSNMVDVGNSLVNTHNVTNMNNMFNQCTILTITPFIDYSSCKTMSSMYGYCSNLQSTVGDINSFNATSMTSMFYGCKSLTTIGVIECSAATNVDNMFKGCDNLTMIGGLNDLKVSLDLSQCPNLEYNSLINILNSLGDGSLNQATLTLGSNVDKLTDDDKSIAINKGWTIA